MAGSRSSTRLMGLYILLFAPFFALGSATSQVPFLMWSSERLPPLASPTAGHIASYEQLSAYLTSAFSSGSHTVLLFLQDKLSKDDFTVFGGVFGNKEDSAFKNIEDAMQSSTSKVTLPALEWSGSFNMAALLQEKLGVSPVLVDADTLSHLTIKTSVSNLLLINLPYCSSLQKSCKEVLHENDEIIGKVLSSMKAKNIPYTAIYTGFQPSRVISETPISDQPVGRSLLQADGPEVKPPIMFNVSGGPCIMLWAQNLTVRLSPSSPWIDLAQDVPSFVGSLCNGSTSRLVLSYQSGFRLSFSMSKRFYSVSAREWFSLDAVELQYANLSASYIASRDIYAPAEYSFHCQSVANFGDILLHTNTTDTNSSQWRLNFIDFQIQGFGLANSTNFSYASDCASFFTPAIWMGLVTVLLTLLILVYGLHMIMQINTMDRFDDPKGPSISVPQSE
ncbi:V-type proton ATPase subunit S1 [Maylandia zebra]|uniref:ATPase H+ transporting accessory protein 1b n=2 Tax=Haplochromini TaxID=319058 RepID=A0A3P9DA84_9CICH|nr:V-type proton ATPase subunit S1 [Maylandia zebra]XP_026009935.1 V-type proton ATPase subunit S1-like [Astatotilapia calliptera]